MAITEVYVDPSIAAASGAGTIGDPYGDIQHALNTKVRDAVNGDRFNIKAGTDEILAAALDLSTYGTPTDTAPLWFQGYTAAQGDGGIGGIDGDGSFSIINNSNLDLVSFCDMHLHNPGANPVIRLDNACNFINCEIDGGTYGLWVDSSGTVINCHIHNFDEYAIRGWGYFAYNYLEETTSDATYAMYTGAGTVAVFNVIKLKANSTAGGIIQVGDGSIFVNNTIYGNGSNARGIFSQAGANSLTCFNNLITDFSGAGGSGGIGIGLAASVNQIIVGYNAFFNCNTNFSDLGASYLQNLTANDVALAASPFVDAANSDFRVNNTVKGLGYPTSIKGLGTDVRPYMDMGGLERQDSPYGGHVWGAISYWRHRP